MIISVLISCMHQENADIIKRSNIQTDVVIVNQCDVDKVEEFDFLNKKGQTCHATYICTTERGLSRSRNKAIKNAGGADICLLCDDDEYLVDGYDNIIAEAYTKADNNTAVISFAYERTDKVMPKHEHFLNIKDICKTSSVEITFRRSLIVDNDIEFDVLMGSGSGNGAGEENKFLMDIRRAGYKLKYDPHYIGKLLSYDSQWFKGWTKKYFRDNGWTSRRIFGNVLGYMFAIYRTIHHYKKYRNELSYFDAFVNTNKGFFEKR